MGLLFLFAVGAALGWVAAIVVRAEDVPGVLRNVAVGIGGAVLAGFVVSPLLGRSDLLRGAYHVDALLIALGGSALLLLAVNLLQRGQMR